MIKKLGNKYCIFSKKTGKKLSCHDTKEQAEKREKQIKFFVYLSKKEGK